MDLNKIKTLTDPDMQAINKLIQQQVSSDVVLINQLGFYIVNSGGKVTAEVVNHGRGEKIKIVKFRRRKHSRSQMGHRQWFTEVKITAINA